MSDLDQILELIGEIAQDKSVPKNVRNSLQRAKEDLTNDKLDLEFRVSSAVSILDEVSNDINLPPYSRTQIWNVVASLEKMNLAMKGQ